MTALDGREVSAPVKQAAELVATVVGQDLEARDDGLIVIVIDRGRHDFAMLAALVNVVRLAKLSAASGYRPWQMGYRFQPVTKRTRLLASEERDRDA